MAAGKKWNRRDFQITSAGFYTVLSAARWFSTLQLPDGYRYKIKEDGKPKRQIHENDAPGAADSETTVQFQMVGSTEGKFRLLRLLGIVVAAIGLTFFLLFCCGGLDGELNRLHR